MKGGFGKITAVLATLCLAVVSCKAPYTPSDQECFAQEKGVCMMVGYKHMIDFSSGDLQYSFNPGKNIYRAGVTLTQRDENEGLDVQTVQEYYVLKTEEPLKNEGQAIRGKLTLCSSALASGLRSYELKSAIVTKVEKDLVWIWDSELHLGVVVAVAQ